MDSEKTKLSSGSVSHTQKNTRFFDLITKSKNKRSADYTSHDSVDENVLKNLKGENSYPDFEILSKMTPENTNKAISNKSQFGSSENKSLEGDYFKKTKTAWEKISESAFSVSPKQNSAMTSPAKFHLELRPANPSKPRNHHLQPKPSWLMSPTIKPFKTQEPQKVEENTFIGEFLDERGFKIVKGFLTSKKTKKLYYIKYQPKENPKANIIALHGFFHSGRVTYVAEQFVMKGYAVHLIDFSGFGYSGGARVNSSIEELHHDFHSLLTSISQSIPLFVYAHSLSALVALSFLGQNPGVKVAGVIFSSPLFSLPKNRSYPKLKLFLLKYIGERFDVL